MNTRNITLLCGIVGMFLFSGCTEISMCGRYFLNGGMATIAIRDSVRYSKEIDKGSFSEPEEAFLTTSGDVYVKTYGKLVSDDANMVYILEIPAHERAEFVTKYYHKHKHVSGIHTVDQIVYQSPSLFGYGQEALIDGEPACWVWFNAAPESYSKDCLKVFIPFTYLFDVITSPIQIPIMIDMHRRS